MRRLYLFIRVLAVGLLAAAGFLVYFLWQQGSKYSNDVDSNNDTSGYWRAPVIHATSNDVIDIDDLTSSHPLNSSVATGRIVTALDICHDDDNSV